jgi:uncharacterized membrane protein
VVNFIDYLLRRKIMSKNMGTIDRSIRLTLAAVVVILYLTGVISGVWAIILGALAVIFVVTSSIGFCPLYAPLKLSTRGKG